MGMFTQNYYNIIQYNINSIFCSYNSSYQNEYTVIKKPDPIIFTRFFDNQTYSATYLASSYSNPSSSSGYQTINYCSVPFYSSIFVYGKITPTKSSTYGMVGLIGIIFITTDFEETLDTQYFGSSYISYKAISEEIYCENTHTSVKINYSRNDDTPLYGLCFLSGGYADYTYCIYIHKFTEPITDNSFTIQLTYSIKNGEINVS